MAALAAPASAHPEDFEVEYAQCETVAAGVYHERLVQQLAHTPVTVAFERRRWAA